MANDILKGLTEADIDALALLIKERNRKHGKIDWDNMSDLERASYNKTILPITPMVPYVEYPKILYGMKDGVLHQAQVEDSDGELRLREQYREYEWKRSPLDHGVETQPSIGRGFSIREFVASPVQVLPQGMEPAAFAVAAAEAAKRKPGRPKKVAA